MCRLCARIPREPTEAQRKHLLGLVGQALAVADPRSRAHLDQVLARLLGEELQDRDLGAESDWEQGRRSSR